MIDRTVLFVDDEIDILNSLKRGLIDEEYNCLFALSGLEALEMMERVNVSVVVTDMRMPGMDGLKLLKKIKEKYPNTVRVVLSGYTQLQQILVTINQGDIFKFITKPWKLEDEFKPVIRQALEYHNTLLENIELRKSLEARNASYQNIFKSTEEKLTNNKKDFENIKSISTFTFNKIMNILSDTDLSRQPESNMISQIKHMYFEYLEIIPTTWAEFEIGFLIRSIETRIREARYGYKLEIIAKDKQNNTFYGNHKMLNFVILSLFEQLSQLFHIDLAKLTIDVDKRTQNAVLDVFIEIYLNASYDVECKNKEKDLNMVGLFFNELGRTINGSVVTYKFENTVMVKIRL